MSSEPRRRDDKARRRDDRPRRPIAPAGDSVEPVKPPDPVKSVPVKSAPVKPVTPVPAESLGPMDWLALAGPADPADAADAADLADAADPADIAPDPALASRSALARARKAARERGFRPGMKPAPHSRRIAGIPSSRTPGDDRDPALLGAQLERLLVDRGWSADVTVGSVMGRWAEIVGPDIAGHVRPVTFEGSVLTVQAESTAWATQIRLLTSALLGRIEAVVGAGVVTDLVVLGPAAPSWIKGKRRVQGRGPRDTYG